MTQEEAVMTVMRRSGVWRSLLDVASWFAGSYEEMALAGEYARSHGYRFLYDPRPLQFQIEWLGHLETEILVGGSIASDSKVVWLTVFSL